MYPHMSQVSIVGEENTTVYAFNRKFQGNYFCRTCGVQLYTIPWGPPKHIFDSWSEARKEAVRPNFELRPVRIGVLDDVEWEDLKIERGDEGTEGYTVM